jgi:hypothetical protein
MRVLQAWGNLNRRLLTTKQITWLVILQVVGVDYKCMGRTVKISHSRLAVQDRMVHRIDRIDLFSLYAPLFNTSHVGSDDKHKLGKWR